MTDSGGGQLHAMGVPTMLGSAVIQRERGYFFALFWQHKHVTITYCCVFWSFGMCVAFLGPTLLDLGCLVSADLKSMSWIFFAQSLFVLLGSMGGGFLVDRFTSNPVLLVCSVLSAVTLAIVPICGMISMLGITLAVMGVNMGIIDTVLNVSLIRIYASEVSPFLQALHFFYGFGAFVSPIIAEPFLLNEDCTPFVDNTTAPSELEQMVKNGSLATDTLEAAQRETRVENAFWIMAALQVPVCLLVLSVCVRDAFNKGKDILVNPTAGAQDQDKRKGSYEDMDLDQKAVEEEKPKGKKPVLAEGPKIRLWESCCMKKSGHVIAITALAALMLFLYDGMQAAFGGYIYSYGIKSIADMNQTEAAYLNACFWGTFALGRLISIPIATKLSPGFMLICNIFGCFMAMILMLAMRHDHSMLYVGTCGFGLFLSSVYPTAISLVEQYVHVTSSMASAIVVGAATGEMIFPVIVGHMFVNVGPVALLLAGNLTCFLSVFVFIAMWLTGQIAFRHKAARSGLGFIADVCCPQVADEDGLVQTRVKYYSRMSESSLDQSVDMPDSPLKDEALNEHNDPPPIATDTRPVGN